jgi:HSP20 family protein
MRLRSLVPFRENGTALMPPGFGLFGLHREIDRLFNDFAQGIGPAGAQANIVPSIEISETDKAIEVSAEMPGLERKDVEISIEEDTLTIRGEKKVEENQNDKNVQHSERVYGVFMRVLQLPPRHRFVKRPGNDVQRYPEDHNSEAGETRAEEDRGQGSF